MTLWNSMNNFSVGGEGCINMFNKSKIEFYKLNQCAHDILRSLSLKTGKRHRPQRSHA